jgi:hypothetical protein
VEEEEVEEEEVEEEEDVVEKRETYIISIKNIKKIIYNIIIFNKKIF